MTLQIKVDLNDEQEQQFNDLKDHWNSSSNTATVRHMILAHWKQ